MPGPTEVDAINPPVTPSSKAPAQILVVERDPRVRDLIVAALAPLAVHPFDDVAPAMAACAALRPRVALVGDGVGRDRALALLRHLATTMPSCRRILLASYHDVASLVNDEVRDCAQLIIPVPQRGGPLATTIRNVLAEDDLDIARWEVASTASLRLDAADIAGFIDEGSATVLGQWATRRLARIPGAVVRPLPADGGRVEVVVKNDRHRTRFLRSLERVWGPPVRELPKDHPLQELLGGLKRTQQVFTVPFSREDTHVYCAVLPWDGAATSTVVVGFVGRDPGAVFSTLGRLLHQAAVGELLVLVVPPRPDPEGRTARYDLAYDWVVTQGYVGTDRRTKPTSALNKYVLTGRRQAIPGELQARGGWFVDRLTPSAKRHVIAVLAMSALDTVFSLIFIGRGQLEEMNALLRPLVRDAPALFVLVKSAIALLTIGVVARYQLFRAGLWALRANVIMYAALLLYWLWLIGRR